MGLSNRQKALQDHLTRVAKRMQQKFGVAGIPTDVLIKRVGEKQIALDTISGVTANAYSFTIISNTTGLTTNDQLIVANDAALPTGVYGSATALVMLAKLKAGTDSVDIHVLGDSNTYHSSGGYGEGGYGYLVGLGYGLVAGCSVGSYATPVWSTGVSYSGSGFMYGWGCNGTMLQIGAASDGSGGGVTFDDWKNSPTAINKYMNFNGWSGGFNFSGSASSTTYENAFVWASRPGVTYFFNEGNFIRPYVPGSAKIQNAWSIDTTKALTYRVVHSLIPGNTGATGSSLSLVWKGACAAYVGAGPLAGLVFTYAGGGVGATYYPPAGSAAQTGYRVSTVAGVCQGVLGVTGIGTSKLTWPADANRWGQTLAFNWTGGQSGFTASYGPFAVYLESVHNNSKGWATTLVNGIAGASFDLMAKELEKIGATTEGESALRTIVKETRERQIEAGGSGNLIVWLQSGVNDVGSDGSRETYAATTMPRQLARVINLYKTTWESLGYPENDLAFIVTVSHPRGYVSTNDSEMDSLRVAGKNYAETPSDNNTISPYSNVTFVNITELGANGITYGGMSAGNAFSGNQDLYAPNPDGSDGAHLKQGQTGGYAYISELLVKRCLEYPTSY